MDLTKNGLIILCMEWPELIRQRREACGLTQTQLAVKAGVSLPSIQKMEAGRANPSLKTLSSVFDVLGVDVIFQLREQNNELEQFSTDSAEDVVVTKPQFESPLHEVGEQKSIFSEVASDLSAMAKNKSTRGRVNSIFKLLDKVTDPNR